MNRHRAAKYLLLPALLAAPAGCTRQASVGRGPDDVAAAGTAADPWQTAAAEFRKQTDHATCQRVLNQLNADLSGQTSAPTPQPMPEDAAKALAGLLRLNEEEVREVKLTSYTGLDAAYLADAFYLRDAARSLDVRGLPPEKQAAVGFAWVCRQVYPKVWQVPTPDGLQYGPPLPPTAILRRGYGTGLERAYVFLALLQQLGLDGCLVGPPGQEQAVTQKIVDGKLWKGPFWAVGVLTGQDIALFDPWRGEPLPGPGGKGVGTLAQLKKTPDQVKAWRDDKANPWDVPPADVAGAVAYAAVPVSALSPRIKLLETQLPGLGVKLAADPRGLADRFAHAQAPAAVWAPPDGELFSYTRVLSSFLPKSAGGLLPTDLRLPEQMVSALIPSFRDARPPGLKSDEAADTLVNRLRGEFGAVFIGPGLQEKVHRGQFNEVSRALIEADKPFAAAEARARAAAGQEKAVQTWVARANEVYQRLSAARLPENRAHLPEAEAAVAQFWRQDAAASPVADGPGAAAGRAEVGYLLALCKHEQAERAQLRFERASAAPGDRAKAAAGQARAEAETAWAAAADAWGRYAPYTDRQEATFPGRGDHARKLTARAARLAANPASGL
jgi:hypothetical protein